MTANPFESLSTPEESNAPAAGDPSSASESEGALLPSVVREPIADGSQVLLHDGFDVEVWEEALASFPKLRRTVAEARQQLVTADALIHDLFWSFHRRAVSTEPLVPLTPAYEVNRQVVEQVLSTIEWQQVRDSGTIGDLLTSAIATMTVVRRALEALDAKTIAHVNRLHELESGAAELFAKPKRSRTWPPRRKAIGPPPSTRRHGALGSRWRRSGLKPRRSPSSSRKRPKHARTRCGALPARVCGRWRRRSRRSRRRCGPTPAAMPPATATPAVVAPVGAGASWRPGKS